MGLDEDLGIDSIKRVEILSALQEKLPEAPAVKPEHLGSFQTLQDVVDFLASESTTTAPAVSAGTSAGSSASTVQVQQTLLEVVAEKTGYPVDMLQPEMGLDEDLGIDSIKRVEILSALQEKLPEAPAVKPEHLGSFQTLQDVINFLASSSNTPAAAATVESVGPSSTAMVEQVLLEVVAEKTGYPVEMLQPGMGLDEDLGIDSIKRVEILSALQERLPETPAVKPEHLGTFQTLHDVVEFLASGTSQTTDASTSVAADAQSSVASDGSDIEKTLLEVVAEKTGYPTEMLEPTMGVGSGSGHRLDQTC